MRRAAVVAVAVLAAWATFASAGGPLVVGGSFGQPGVPFTWSTTAPVAYRTDGGNLGRLTNAQAIARVQAMFQVWQDVPTASIAFTRAGSLLGTTGFVAGGDVDTVAEFNAVSTSCNNAQQSPIVFDVNGNLLAALGLPSGVLGITQLCALSSAGRIVSAMVVMNGRYLDGNLNNGELSDDAFDAVFIHEFGHFAGLDHSQIRRGGFWEGLPITPTMYPYLVSEGQKSLAPDDIAWISALYPAGTFSSQYGWVRGTLYFSDGSSPVQGANIEARRLDDPATGEDESDILGVSVVSGYLFTGNLGQPTTGNNTGGSAFGGRTANLLGHYAIPLPPGEYTLDVTSISAAFTGGSGVGPLSPPIPAPGTTPDMGTVVVAAGVTVQRDIVLQGTEPRFDAFEGSGSGALTGTAEPERPAGGRTR